jgi:hypothetical protein
MIVVVPSMITNWYDNRSAKVGTAEQRPPIIITGGLPG